MASVSWWPTHLFVSQLIAQYSDASVPMAGTPEWGALDDGDPRKIIALADAGQHHVLRMETAQEALEQAGQAISEAADWSAISRHYLNEQAFLDAHPWWKRGAA